MNSSKTIPQDTKKVFMKYLTCSRTFSYLLDREFGYINEDKERASDSLAGGLANTANQCGMLWGATLAVGAESFRRNNDRGQATAIAITATQHLMESFSKAAKSVNCQDIIGCDLKNKSELENFMKTAFSDIENSVCFNLAEKWAPEAIQSAKEGLSQKQTDIPQLPVSCASEVAKKMGATDEEMVTVAGFAGGLGLSGNACGALSAAIWMKNLAWCRKHPGEPLPYLDNPDVDETLEAFFAVTGTEILCHKITGQCFKKLIDHTEFIKQGGCSKLISALAKWRANETRER
jgi:hypothetical protein